MFLSIKHYAEKWDISPRTVSNALKNGTLAYEWQGKRKRIDENAKIADKPKPLGNYVERLRLLKYGHKRV